MTVGALVAESERRLASKGVPEAAANAEWIVAHVLGCGRLDVRARHAGVLTPEEKRRVLRRVAQRAKRVPLAYVLGTQDFMGLDLEAGPAALVPRPETEELVQAVVALARGPAGGRRSLRILDIGTGSGCISVALARLLPQARFVATDVSPRALALARRNARRQGVGGRVRFVREDLFQPPRRKGAAADIVVSNPPYVPTAEIATLEPEVGKEPRAALDGGEDGLDAIRAIAARAPMDLKPGGWLALEIGYGEAPAVRRLLRTAGFRKIEIRKDLQGVERIVLATKLELGRPQS